MELYISRLRDDDSAAHVSGLGGEDAGILEMDAMPQVDAIPRHGWLAVVLKLSCFGAHSKTCISVLAHFVYKIKNVLIYIKR
jgi:hypothetical protein